MDIIDVCAELYILVYGLKLYGLGSWLVVIQCIQCTVYTISCAIPLIFRLSFVVFNGFVFVRFLNGLYLLIFV